MAKKRNDRIEIIESVEKTIENTIKKNKKQIFGTVLLIAFAIILFFIITISLGIQINFILKDELKITIEPLQQALTLAHDMNQSIEFSVEVDNFRSCKAECTLTLRSVSRNKTVWTDTRDFTSGESYLKTFQFTGDHRGEGQIVYLFDAECNNIKSTLCRTAEEKRYKSSIITLNYKLTAEEKEIQNKSQIAFQKSVNTYAEARNVIQNTKLSLPKLSDTIEKEIIFKNTDRLTDEAQQVQRQLENLADVWDTEDYVRFQSLMDRMDDVVSLSNEAMMNFNVFLDIVLMHNMNIEKLANLSDTAILEDMRVILKERVDSYVSQLNDTILLWEIGGFNSYEEMDSEIMHLENRFRQLLERYDSQKEQISSYGSFHVYRAYKTFDQSHNLVPLTLSEVCQEIQSLMKTNRTMEHSFSDVDTELATELNGSKYAQFLITPENDTNTTEFSVPEELTDYLSMYCTRQEVDVRDMTIEMISPSIQETDFNIELAQHTKQCCLYNVCNPCEKTKKNPVLFVHGHALDKTSSPEINIKRFGMMQKYLQGYVNGGIIEVAHAEEVPQDEWQYFPVSVRASYYYVTFYDVGNYMITTEKSDSIENYAIRLKEIIDTVKYRTGADKVDIVAHSMGGLVSRAYMMIFGEEDVNRLIMIGTPNKGITGSVKKYCAVTGADKECEDMYEDSIFMKQVNSPRNIPQDVDVHTIIGIGCETEGEEGDGIVTKKSAELAFAENHYIKDSCTDFLKTDLHTRIVDLPETYALVNDILDS